MEIIGAWISIERYRNRKINAHRKFESVEAPFSPPWFLKTLDLFCLRVFDFSICDALMHVCPFTQHCLSPTLFWLWVVLTIAAKTTPKAFPWYVPLWLETVNAYFYQWRWQWCPKGCFPYLASFFLLFSSFLLTLSLSVFSGTTTIQVPCDLMQ